MWCVQGHRGTIPEHLCKYWTGGLCKVSVRTPSPVHAHGGTFLLWFLTTLNSALYATKHYPPKRNNTASSPG